MFDLFYSKYIFFIQYKPEVDAKTADHTWVSIINDTICIPVSFAPFDKCLPPEKRINDIQQEFVHVSVSIIFLKCSGVHDHKTMCYKYLNEFFLGKQYTLFKLK